MPARVSEWEVDLVVEAAADGDHDHHHHHIVAKVFTTFGAVLLRFDVELCNQNLY